MKISVLIAAALAFVLTACVTRPGPPETVILGKRTLTLSGLEGFDASTVKQPDPNRPNIFIINNEIVIDQEPLRPLHKDNLVIILWALDRSDASPYIFPDNNAIKLTAGTGNPLPDPLDCGTVGARKKVFACVYDKPSAYRKWKYTVKVKNTTGTDPTPLDPWVHQN